MVRRFHARRVPDGTGVFNLMNAAKNAAAAAGGHETVDLSVGTPDLAPPPEALQALRDAADDPATYKYCLRPGTMPLLRAAVAWYASHYGVQLDPGTQALSLVGSQEGLAHLLMAVADPGDAVLMCDIGYACYLPAVRVAGLEPRLLPVTAATGHLPDLSSPAAAAAAGSAAPRCRALLLNYPNNPTAAVAGDVFWQAALDFCERHDLLLINDNPYVAQVYGGGGLASSPLTRPRALERAVELFSFAKSYQMGGFRLGFALGNADAIAALEAVKAPIDFNQYVGIQRMGIACLQLPHRRLQEYAAVFAARAAALVAALRERAGWDVPLPKACMYLWAKLPEGFEDDTAFCLALVSATGVALAPGSGFGPGGAGHVRFALVRDVPVLEAAAGKVAAFLRSPMAAALRSGGGGGVAAAAAAAIEHAP